MESWDGLNGFFYVHTGEEVMLGFLILEEIMLS